MTLTHTPSVIAPSMRRYLTDDGGASQGRADLWCTYAAVRALAWLDAKPRDIAACRQFLLDCQNANGGFGWQRGMQSDVWATYYCTQALAHLGVEVPRAAELSFWMESLATP